MRIKRRLKKMCNPLTTAINQTRRGSSQGGPRHAIIRTRSMNHIIYKFDVPSKAGLTAADAKGDSDL
jgi:hypothetical protein